MNKIFILSFICFALVLSEALSQNLPTNNMEGTLTVEQQTVSFIFRTEFDMDRYTTYMYIPQQMIYAKKASSTTVDKDSIKIIYKDFGAGFYGRIVKDSMYADGIWKQSGQSFDLDLKFLSNSEAQTFKRTQDPKPPYPYKNIEIAIPNKKDKIQLHGTLTLPNADTIYPLVILITGSGAQDRNEEIGGHKPFLVLADYLSRNGIAVFRYDDRGTGKSEGHFMTATTMDFMNDALAVVQFFKKYPNINPKKIGLIGHSEGGLIAMMAAAKSAKNIAFIISMAGPGVPMVDLLLKQNEDISRAAGMNEDMIELMRTLNFQLYNLVLTEEIPDSAINRLPGIIDEITEGMTSAEKDMYGLNPESIRMLVMQLYTPWMRYFLAIKPADYLVKIKCPVLAINGSLDIQVSAEENLQAIERYLTEGKNTQFKTQQIKGLNHLFQYAQKGTMDEYMLIEETINIQALQCIVDFINEQK